MRFTRDRRGQSVVVGTVILFGFLILALASYQAFAVPAQNNQAEFDHSQDLQSDMEDLRASLLDVRDARQNPYQRPVRVSLGTRYESRLFVVNPPPPDGALTTQNRGDINISGASVVNEQDFSNTEPLFDDSHPTQLLTYRPNYNEYRNPPRTTFEHSLLYNRFEGANQTVTGQRTVDGDSRQITLVAYSDDLNRQGVSTTIDPETLDGPTPTVPIEPESGDEFTVTLPTHSPSVWEDLLTEEPNVAIVGTTASSITVELGGEWDLQMARVGYDGGSVAETPFSNVTRVDDERIDGNASRTLNVEWDEPEPVPIAEGGEEPLTVEVTDRESGNFIEDASIDASFTRIEGPGTLTLDDDFLTDESGRADVTVGADEADAGDEFDVYASTGDDVDVIRIEVIEANQAELRYVVGSSDDANNNGRVTFELENVGSAHATITGIRVDSTTDAQASRVNNDANREYSGGGGSLNLPSNEFLEIGAASTTDLDTNAEIAQGSTETFSLQQFRQDNGNSRNMNGDDVTITVELDDGTTTTITVEDI